MILKKIFMIPAAFLLTGCYSLQDISGDRYSANRYDDVSVGAEFDTYVCTIINVAKVEITEKKNPEEEVHNSAVNGGIVGTLAGAVIGSQFGGGSGKVAGLIAGAAVGAAAGSGIAGNESVKRNKKMPGYSYTVRLDGTSEIKTVVQGADILMQTGQRAYLLVPKQQGIRSRLIPLTQINNLIQ